MPAKSEKQRKFMGAALSCKEGKGTCRGKIGKAAKGMSKNEIKKFTRKKKK